MREAKVASQQLVMGFVDLQFREAFWLDFQIPLYDYKEDALLAIEVVRALFTFAQAKALTMCAHYGRTIRCAQKKTAHQPTRRDKDTTG